MIWSLVKAVIFMGLIAALTFGVTALNTANDEIRLSVAAMEFTLTPLAGAVLAMLALVVAWIALRLTGLAVAVLRFFNGDETAISRYFDRNREQRGFEALADGMIAIAAGEGKVAMAKAAKADKFLQRPELTLLLSAQAAELSGDSARAQGIYRQLLNDDRTRFVGVQGILKQKLLAGDTDTALKLAEKAFALRPGHGKTIDTLFALQSRNEDWAGARKTLAAKLSARDLPRDVHMRRDGVLALAQARHEIDKGNIDAAHEKAMQANKLSPELIPAAVLVAETHVLNEAPKKAAKVLAKAWAAQPHPDLAAAFADIEPDEDAAARRKRFAALLKVKPDDPETRLLAAELALMSEDFAGARAALGDLAEVEPTTRALTVMAAIERGEGSPDNVVRGWLTKALDAPRGPRWICDSCHNLQSAWSPVCDNCESFDTLSWRVPPEAEGASEPRATSMLPLIVGALEETVDETDELEELVDVTGE